MRCFFRFSRMVCISAMIHEWRVPCKQNETAFDRGGSTDEKNLTNGSVYIELYIWDKGMTDVCR